MKVKKGCNSADVGVPMTTEEDLLASTVITPEDVLGLQKITESKLLPLLPLSLLLRTAEISQLLFVVNHAAALECVANVGPSGVPNLPLLPA